MTNSTAIELVAKALLEIAKEMNKLTQEIVKLNERIEDATSHSARRGEA